MCTGGQRDVKTIIDDDSRLRTQDGFHACADETHHARGIEIPFAHLYQMNAGQRGRPHPIHERAFPPGTIPAPIRDHAYHWAHEISLPEMKEREQFHEAASRVSP